MVWKELLKTVSVNPNDIDREFEFVAKIDLKQNHVVAFYKSAVRRRY